MNGNQHYPLNIPLWQFNFLRMKSIILPDIQALLWLKNWTGNLSMSTFLNIWFPNNNCNNWLNFTFISCIHIKAIVTLCLAFLPPLYSSPFSPKPFSGNAWQNNPFHLHIFRTSFTSYSATISASLPFQEETVSTLKSPAFPLTTICLTLCLFFHDSSQPFDALK